MAIAALALAGAALACNFPGRATEDPGGRATSLAQTAEAILTQTAAVVAPTSPPAPSATSEQQQPPPTQAASDTPVIAPTLPNTPIPLPTDCENESDFVADITVPDGTEFEPNANFTKTWRLKNSGTCTWGAAYRFVHIAGEAMGASGSVPLPAVVPPGEEINISVSFVAPGAAGTYRSRWQLEGPGGQRFGTRPFVEIVVK